MTSSSFDRLVEILPILNEFHGPSSDVYQFLNAAAKDAVEQRFGPNAAPLQSLWPFGEIAMPFHNMGAVDSADLFGLDELILFSFYWSNRQRYRRTLDLGANLGLHSIIMDRCGFEVRAYEPDPVHFALLVRNLKLNNCASVTPNNAAVSDRTGEAEFTRVLGNTTSSHLSGSKSDPYGLLEKFTVAVADIRPLMDWADLVKLDVEGHERQIFVATTVSDWQSTDMMLEVGSPDNAEAIHAHCVALGLKLYAQKDGWKKVAGLDSMPTSYRDGSLFVTSRSAGPWLSPEVK